MFRGRLNLTQSQWYMRSYSPSCSRETLSNLESLLRCLMSFRFGINLTSSVPSIKEHPAMTSNTVAFWRLRSRNWFEPISCLSKIESKRAESWHRIYQYGGVVPRTWAVVDVSSVTQSVQIMCCFVVGCFSKKILSSRPRRKRTCIGLFALGIYIINKKSSWSRLCFILFCAFFKKSGNTKNPIFFFFSNICIIITYTYL